MTEQDEEVVFEKSPLDRYLKDIVPDEYLIAARDDGKSKVVDAEDASLQSPDDQNSWKTCLLEKFQWMADCDSADFDTLVWDMKCSVWKSGLLDGDDLHFLQSVDPQCFQNPIQDKHTLSWHVTVIDVVAVCGLISALLSQLILAYQDFSSTLHIFVLIMMMLTGLMMSALLLLKYQFLLLCWEWQQLVADFKSLVTRMKSCFEVYAKSIKLVEEQDLITSGYSRNSDQFEKSSAADIRGCPALRVTMENMGIPLLLALREATCQLVLQVPVSCYVDDSSHYIAFVKLESLDVSEQSSTMPKSLSRLKYLIQLIRSQTSEYFRRVLLCFMKQNLYHSRELNTMVKLFKPSLSHLQKLCRKWYSTIGDALEFQKRLLTENNQIRVVEKLLQTCQDSDSRVASLLHAANNMEIRLQSALLRVRDLAQHVNSSEHCSQPTAVEAIGEWLVSDVSFCTSSSQSLLSSLNLLLHPELEVEANTNMDCSSSHHHDEGEREPQVIVSKTEMSFENETDEDEDKVYEAYVAPDEVVQLDDFRSSTQHQESGAAQHVAEDPMKMIIELKGVLAAKATAKMKSELNTEKAETMSASDMSEHTPQKAMRSKASVGQNAKKEDFSKDYLPSVDMRKLAAAIAEMQWRKTANTDELEASGETDSSQSQSTTEQ